MIRKSTILLFLAFLLCLLSPGFYVGCSDDDESSDPTPTATPTATPTPTPPPNEPPDTTITGGPDIATSFPVVFSYIGQDAEDPVESLTYAIRLDAGAWSEWTAQTTASFSDLAEGDHVFEVKARDILGAEDPTPASKTFTVHLSSDTESPETWVSDGPTGTIHFDDVRFVFSGSDNATATENLLFSWKLDAQDWSGYSTVTEIFWDDLAEGSHTFEVRARDEAGNVDPTPARNDFTIDLTYYGFFMNPGYASQSVPAGTEAVFQVDLANTGSLNGTFQFSLGSQVPSDWSATFCLSNGQCVVGVISLEFPAGATDFMTLHIYTAASPPGTQGSATLTAVCLEDTSVTASSTATAIIQ